MEETPIVAVSVKIFGKEYTVACPEGQEQALILSSKRVDQEMRHVRESGKVLGTDRIAVMVALNLAHELLNQQGLSDQEAYA
ncbi:MAG TPA: cell division protein ZapA, partial [Thiolinea sp.]|nr:cell division protein ZapA [Thiolinea sp.]